MFPRRICNGIVHGLLVAAFSICGGFALGQDSDASSTVKKSATAGSSSSEAELSRDSTTGQASSGTRARPALQIVVMDPLSDQLACDCVAGYAQRKYDALAAFLEEELSRPVGMVYAESLLLPNVRRLDSVDLVIGKFSEAVADARRTELPVRPIAMLSGNDGSVTQAGLFVVRADDAAKSIEDIKNYRVLLGPVESDEKHSAALATFEAFDLPLADKVSTSSSCNSAALAVVEKDADVAVISSYAMPLLEGCGTVDKGALRILDRTDPVPFIAVFATDQIDDNSAQEIRAALVKLAKNPQILEAMESKLGFLAMSKGAGDGPLPAASWTDWRGPNRDARCDQLPTSLPEQKRLLWSRTCTGPGMAGMALADRRLIVTDKSLEAENDVFRCLDSHTGRQIWSLDYPAPGEMDFTNSPRANPVIRDGLVYLLGAFGNLHCLKLDTGDVVWKKNLVADFGAELPMWGYSSTPLLIGDKLIVNPGAKDAALVALHRKTGKVLWSTPGEPPGYASFVLARFGGVRQIVGYDTTSLGGWDPETGRRLWQLVPELDGDFNVPTPIAVEGRLLVSTENNGTRLYEFDDSGRIKPQPVAVNEDLAPDTSTPVVIDGLVFGSSGEVVCLDLDDGLKTLWQQDEDPWADYCSFIAGNGRVLVTTQVGVVSLIEVDRRTFKLASSLNLFDDVSATERDIWSHPIVADDRLYVRNLLGVYCFLIGE
jgi:outer membrane protein assembly factor BamB/ABC-type phosphate/phosphonate transport system substrate-binding protein